MQLTLKRTTETAKSTIGELLIDGVHECYTLEPPVKHDGTKPRAIDCGTYPVTMGVSPRFARILPHVRNVPDFAGILIHWGNFPRDTEGCILVGRTIDNLPNQIDESRLAFEELFQKLLKSPETTLTVTEAAPSQTKPVAVKETA